VFKPEHHRLIDDLYQAKALCGAEIDAICSGALYLLADFFSHSFNAKCPLEQVARCAGGKQVFYYY
jgi:hypothetical protein